jgi:hypothetical protein
MSTIAITPRTIRTRPVAPSHVRGQVRVQPHVQARVQAQVRLTRRGRFVVFFAGLLLVLTVGFGFGARSAATDTPEATQVITVAPGDTLWGIAAEIAPGDTRAMVSHIEQLNGMDSAGLQVGQQLVVPAAG